MKLKQIRNQKYFLTKSETLHCICESEVQSSQPTLWRVLEQVVEVLLIVILKSVGRVGITTVTSQSLHSQIIMRLRTTTTILIKAGLGGLTDLTKRNFDNIYKMLKISGVKSGISFNLLLRDYESFGDCQTWWKEMRSPDHIL